MTDTLVPKTLSVLKEGYSLDRLRSDALSGLTVAIVALPLSMAIAIASGVTPDRGLYTAIFGGFVVSLLGGSRHQIGGPAGAFIVLVAACVAKNGVEGLILATAMSGVMMMIAGWFRLGRYIKFIPYPVTVGFTAGIGVIIFASQIHDLFGLKINGNEPGPLLDKLVFLAENASTFSPAATSLAAITIIIILALKILRPSWPGLLIAVALSSLAAYFLHLPVETIGTKFGGIPSSVPMPHLPQMNSDLFFAVLPDAVSFTLLGAIESLLSAVVADGMTGRRHRSSMELIGQGAANIVSALFGGICVTGTIARTATNVRSGATSPFSGMLHSLFLLIFLLIAAPLASYIPLSALAGVLAFVAYNMVEKHSISALFRSSRADTVVLLATFLFVIFRDLTEGIIVGFTLGAFIFIDRMGKNIQIAEKTGVLAGLETTTEETESPIRATDPDTVVYHISGVFFFGAASHVGAVLDRISDQRKNFILDCSAVPFLDSTAANVIEGSVRRAKRGGVRFIIAGASDEIRQMLKANHVSEPDVEFHPTLEAASKAVGLKPVSYS
ncbi:SulP family inorganic anion transporter [Rhizobium sp. L1K21]|uniref:SulP family inorganic anion transporter n=1 Tax=Rhizobium sp. L1K21 TaxID=2954933 RepID=UPI00209336B3|nr:SulP family inorganic anion transporter [Rhizobium sp. L1K21]MCO6186170.1 SulP family inorganic anion transporter [Rhizobium sp. L1K21]